MESNQKNSNVVLTYIKELEDLAQDMGKNAQEMVEKARAFSPEALELAMISSKLLGQVEDLRKLLKKIHNL